MEDKNEKQPKKEWSAKKITTTIIIVILAFLMVGSSFYMLFAPGYSDDVNAYGYYNKKPILNEPNNTFGRTLWSDPEYVRAAEANDTGSILQTLYGAYQAEVVYMAVSEQAEDAKIIAPKKLVENMILDSGVFNNEDGEFDEKLYRSIPESNKQAYFQYIKNATPYQIALNDYSTVLIPSAQKDFISQYNKDLRDLSYFNVNYSVYPDNLAREYASNNSDWFDKFDLSIITCTTEEQANKVYSELNEGKDWSDAVKEYSEDNFKENDGAFGTEIYSKVVETNLRNVEDMSFIRGLEVGQYTKPLEGPYAFALYKLNAPIKNADFSDNDTLDYAKSVIYSENADEVKPYIEEAVEKATEQYQTDFTKTAEQFSSGLQTLEGVNNNVGESTFVIGLQYADAEGYLTSALQGNEELAKNIFTGNAGDVFGPVETDNGTLFVRIDSLDSSSDLSEAMDESYDLYEDVLVLNDLQDSVMNSPKHDNRFFEKFIQLMSENN